MLIFVDVGFCGEERQSSHSPAAPPSQSNKAGRAPPRSDADDSAGLRWVMRLPLPSMRPGLDTPTSLPVAVFVSRASALYTH